MPRPARTNAVLMARSARLIALGESAIQMDAELRPLRQGANRRLRAAFRVIADRLHGAGLLRVGAKEAADTIYAIATEVTYLRMTEGAGIGPERYADWLTDTFEAALSPLGANLSDRAAARRGGPSP